MKIEVSNGEIFDKLSILEVKNEKLTNALKLEIRLKEEEGDFGQRFIELSRLIYKLNDERFRLKNTINIQTNSDFQEQKGHKAT